MHIWVIKLKNTVQYDPIRPRATYFDDVAYFWQGWPTYWQVFGWLYIFAEPPLQLFFYCPNPTDSSSLSTSTTPYSTASLPPARARQVHKLRTSPLLCNTSHSHGPGIWSEVSCRRAASALVHAPRVVAGGDPLRVDDHNHRHRQPATATVFVQNHLESESDWQERNISSQFCSVKWLKLDYMWIMAA